MRNPEAEFDHREKLSYEYVGSLDPLSLDEFMTVLPEINRSCDVDVIVGTLEYAVELSSSKIGIESPAEALAGLRDIDFLLSSALRHGVDVIQRVDGLGDELRRLGSIAHTVPRGTVYTYAAANPTGSRRRTFTGSVEENGFIDAVRDSCLALDDAVEAIGMGDITDDRALVSQLALGLSAMRIMTDSIVSVRRSVSPEYFTNNMRPFFEPIEIDGKLITGAGGAQMQMLALDNMLWGIDSPNDAYKAFFDANVQYLAPTQQRALVSYKESNDGMSILSHLETAPYRYPESLEVFSQIMAQIKKFRYPHRKLAKDNFKIRSSDAVGSGQSKPDVLDVLIDATEDALIRTRRMIDVEE